jgi:hypothetical protein
VNTPRMLLVSIFLLLALTVGLAQSASNQSAPEMSAADLVKAVIYNELHPTAGSDVHWKYRLEKDVAGKQETREVVETGSGSLDRLLLTAGKPLSDSQASDEGARIWRFSHSAAEQQKAEQLRRKDAAQCDALMQMIPDAFLFDYAGQSGNLTRVIFKPNPRFRPPSREGRVLQQMAGEIWIDARMKRLASISGQLINEVRFGGGLLGHLEKGGLFIVKRAEIAPGEWEMTEMTVNMRGKALLFKNIGVQQKEVHSDFERLPADISLADAAKLLLKETLLAANR